MSCAPSSDPRRGLGARGEEIAARHLEARGFELVERNYRTRHGELDLIARDSRSLVFCEVKTRIVRPAGAAGWEGDAGADPLGPLAAVGPRKQRQVRAMAREWLAAGRLAGPRPPEIRFDAIGVSLDPRGRLLGLDHVEAAF